MTEKPATPAPAAPSSPADKGKPVLHRYDPSQPVAVPAPVAKAEAPTEQDQPVPGAPKPAQPVEIGGPTGPEPTRYGDWERNGRVSDF